jgi:hypothetical protein
VGAAIVEGSLEVLSRELYEDLLPCLLRLVRTAKVVLKVHCLCGFPFGWRCFLRPIALNSWSWTCCRPLMVEVLELDWPFEVKVGCLGPRK